MMPPRRRAPMLSPRAKRAKNRARKKAKQQKQQGHKTTTKDDYLSSMANAYLSAHILHEIFIRMPTKPLVQLKCLSKYWNRQISDPNFMKLRSRSMIFLPSIPFHAIDNTSAPSMIKLFSPEITTNSCYNDMTIVGSFNGIFFLVLKYGNPVVDHVLYDDEKILYNPFTGESKTIPHSQSFDPYSNYVYGFGYGDDLKIVRLKDNSSGDSKSYEVFTLKTWSWTKPLELTGDYFVTNSHSGIFASGFLYWNAVSTAPSRHSLILALDIKNMAFSEMEIPDGRCFIRLGTYNTRLCMLCSQSNVAGYELRIMMNEHEFEKSWSTVLSLKSSSFTMLFTCAYLSGMLCILDDGKLLMWHWSKQQLVIYDMVKDRFMQVTGLASFAQKGRLQSLEYVETSVSPSDICSASI